MSSLCLFIGAVELELCKRLKKVADEDKSLDQYGIRRFAEAFDVVPRTLAENSGTLLCPVSCCVFYVLCCTGSVVVQPLTANAKEP